MSANGLLFSENAATDHDGWEGIASENAADENSLYLELDGWEGPLDLLLDLARRQKVDLRSISILSLVDQYLDYIDTAEALKLELAADYLVMAAWLAYLKSAMLLPKEEQPRGTGFEASVAASAPWRNARCGRAPDGG